jgi:hypothetical protein
MGGQRGDAGVPVDLSTLEVAPAEGSHPGHHPYQGRSDEHANGSPVGRHRRRRSHMVKDGGVEQPVVFGEEPADHFDERRPSQ